MRNITFKTNWNNKLDCKAFSMIRLDGTFEVLQKVRIVRDGHKTRNADVVAKFKTTLDQLTDYICFLDSGYSAQEMKRIMMTMHQKSVRPEEWAEKPIYLYLIKYSE